MNDAPSVLLKWAQEGKSWAEAILVRAQHSSPRPPGARLAVNAQGEMAGAISMGCVENDVREHLLQVLQDGAPRLVHYGATNEFTYEVGLSCGGEIDVLLRVQPPDEVWQALAQRPPDQPAILLTGIAPPCMGRQMILFPDGRRIGTLGSDTLDRDAVAAAGPLWARGGTDRLELNAFQVFAELLEPMPQLAIVGASPMAVALCRMAAIVGFRVTVVDPRRSFGRAELFPDAAQVLNQWPEEGLHAAGIDAQWFVAVLAHDAKLDLPALASALHAHCYYIGLLGSRVTQEKRRHQLQEMGFPPEALRSIHGPIGLRFSAVDPEEIAVSILAEMIGARRSGCGRNAA